MNIRSRNAWLPIAGLIALTAHAADAAPEFLASGIARKTLAPGAILSLYGRNLGAACVGAADPQRRETPNPRAPDSTHIDTSIYPNELCGTQVFIGNQSAGLLYVSGSQINFKIPQDAPESGRAEVRVVYRGQSSLSVWMDAGFEKTAVSLDGPAYTDMPVWLRLDLPLPWAGDIGYPAVLGTAGFGCNEVEIRRNGQVLPVLPGSNWTRGGIVFAGNVCGAYPHPGTMQDRLPLHLIYRFSVPGMYEVRYTLWGTPFGAGSGEMRLRSEWTSVEVLPSKPNVRAEWLEALRRRAPTDAAELLSDVLPGVVGLPDRESLEFVIGYLYHSDELVRQFAMNGLNYWPEDLVARRLLAVIQARGSNKEVDLFLSRHR